MRWARWIEFAIALSVTVLCSHQSAAETATRAASFAFDATSGLLMQEVIEPNTPALRLQIDYHLSNIYVEVAIVALELPLCRLVDIGESSIPRALHATMQ